MAQGMRTRKTPPRCTAQPDVALAMTLPRLLKPMIRAAADSEKPTELSTAGVQNVTVTSTMKIVKNGTQSRSVGTARLSINRCLTGTLGCQLGAHRQECRRHAAKPETAAEAIGEQLVQRGRSRGEIAENRKHHDGNDHEPFTAENVGERSK